jgi:prophage maintenance system killer protein
VTEYLSLDSVVAINGVHCGAGSGVRDREGLAGAIGRPSSGSFDHEFFPDLWTKAAVYLHGLSSTQYFHDGNKRTAWLAATVFLRINGVRVPHVPDVESEAFVLAVAKDLFKTSDEQTAPSRWRPSGSAAVANLHAGTIPPRGTWNHPNHPW